jgi:hypothetical protein
MLFKNVDFNTLEFEYTVKPVLRVPLWTKEWSFRTGDLLNEIQFIYNFPRQDKKRMTF